MLMRREKRRPGPYELLEGGASFDGFFRPLRIEARIPEGDEVEGLRGRRKRMDHRAFMWIELDKPDCALI